MKKLFNKQNILIIFLVIITAALLFFNIAEIMRGNSKELSFNFDNQQIGDIETVMDCFNSSDGQQLCLDNFMREYFGSKTTREVLAELERARVSNSKIENSCHPIAHAVGRTTYEKIKNVGDAFEACDQSCHSGCYHGVMERLFYSDEEITDVNRHLTYEDMKTKIPGICDRNKFNNPNNSVIFQCLHGVGHAILYSLDYKLEDSLKSCDLLSTFYEQSSCYGGVIMENVTSFDKKKRDIDINDPLYPCNKLDTKYKADCYTMQTSLMFEYGLSIEEIAQNCLKAENYQTQCFVSLGRDLSNYVRMGNVSYVVDACELHSKGYEVNCINGTIYALIDNTWDARFAYPFCKELNSEKLKNDCYQNANSYLQWSYGNDNEQIRQSCNTYAGLEVEICQKNIF